MPARARPRKAAGWLAERIVRLLDGAERPLGAVAIGAELRELHGVVHDSAIFRTLAILMAENRVEKVELIAAYRAHRPSPPMATVCGDCGGYAEIDADAVATDLGNLARSRGFRATRLVLEVLGKCAACRTAERAGD